MNVSRRSSMSVRVRRINLRLFFTNDVIGIGISWKGWPMPKFSNTSFTRLSTCHIDLQTLFYEVVRSFDCTILEGHRNEADQNAAFDRGNSKLKWPNGKHNTNPSNAVDVAPWPMPAWGNTQDFIYFGGYVMGLAQRLFDEGKITHRIRYGGDWSKNQRISDESFRDYVHFEITV